MKIGFLSGPLDGIDVKEVFAFAKTTGASTLELTAWPSDQNIRKEAAEFGLEISAIGYYANSLEADKGKAQANLEGLYRAIDYAARNDVNLVCTLIGGNPYLTLDENLKQAEERIAPVVDYANSQGIRLAFENNPKLGHPGSANIAYSPELWDSIFKKIPRIGLELDPSHLVWQGIDYLRAARDYAPKIFHVHAKDAEIINDELSRTGILGKGWWRYRLPGWGNIDWRAFITSLADGGYDDSIDLELDDFMYRGSIGEAKKGISAGVSYLSQLI